MSRSVLPVVLPTSSLLAYSAAVDASAVGSDVRLQLDHSAPAADAAAVYTTDDPTMIAGTTTKTFNGADPTSWPPRCTLVATLTGTQVCRLPDVVWGRAVVVQRIVGTTACNVLASGRGVQEVVTVAAPTTVGNYTATASVMSVAGPAEVSFEKTAASTDTAEVYATDDTCIAGTGTPPAATLLGTIVGGGVALEVPGQLMAAYISIKRTAGTGAFNVLFSGQRDAPPAPAALSTLPPLAAGTNGSVILMENRGVAPILVKGAAFVPLVDVAQDDADWEIVTLYTTNLDDTGPVAVSGAAFTTKVTGGIPLTNRQQVLFGGFTTPLSLAPGKRLVAILTHGGAGKAIAGNGAAWT